MLRLITIAFSMLLAVGAMAHTDSKWSQGPNGGHIVDAGGGKQHWELSAKGNELTLHITDESEKPVDVSSGSASAQVLVKGKTYKVDFKPAGGNVMKANGPFEADKGMRVIVKTQGIGGQSFQARLAPQK